MDRESSVGLLQERHEAIMSQDKENTRKGWYQNRKTEIPWVKLDQQRKKNEAQKPLVIVWKE